MADILRNDDALKENFERSITQRASEIIGAEQELQLGQYVVMMLLDSYITEDTVKTEVKTMTDNALGDDFVAWCKQEMDQIAGSVSNSGSTEDTNNNESMKDTEMEDYSKAGNIPGRRPKENPLKARIDRHTIGGVGKASKDRGRNGISKAFKEGEGYSIKSKGGNESSVPDAAAMMLAQMQNALSADKSLPPQERFNQRCRNWPTCRFDNCKYVHPTEGCDAFASNACPAPPGICLKVHVGQDIDDLAKLPPQPKPFEWVSYGYQGNYSKPAVPGGLMLMPVMTPNGPQQVLVPQAPIQPVASSVMVCRFVDKCSNQNCTYGHPTPCNSKAEITDGYKWCEAKEKCEDESCGLNHPSSQLIRENGTLPTGPSLEQCKFDSYCNNAKCRFRHATSFIVCRDGKGCTRMDCFFRHPADCKFGVNCKNPKCVFAHPEGRDNGTSERKFVNDEPVESLIPGQAAAQAPEVPATEVDTNMEG